MTISVGFADATAIISSTRSLFVTDLMEYEHMLVVHELLAVECDLHLLVTNESQRNLLSLHLLLQILRIHAHVRIFLLLRVVHHRIDTVELVCQGFFCHGRELQCRKRQPPAEVSENKQKQWRKTKCFRT